LIRNEKIREDKGAAKSQISKYFKVGLDERKMFNV